MNFVRNNYVAVCLSRDGVGKRDRVSRDGTYARCSSIRRYLEISLVDYFQLSHDDHEKDWNKPFFCLTKIVTKKGFDMIIFDDYRVLIWGRLITQF